MEETNVKETDLNSQEQEAAKETAKATLPAAPEKPKLFSKGTKSRKRLGGTLIAIGSTLILGLLGKLAFDAGEASGQRKAENKAIDVDFIDVTPVQDAVPFETEAEPVDSNF